MEGSVTDPDFHARGLRGRTVRGALASTTAQVTSLVVRVGSMIVLSRLIGPRDFGLVAMATAVTGFLLLFRDLGLSTASVQRADITHEQLSTLFWLNVSIGALLTVLCMLAAPALVRFYGEPQLLWITVSLSAGFLVNGMAAQHRALLARQMRFGSLAIIDTVALVITVVASIGMAVAGLGYWAVVVMNVGPLAIAGIGVLFATRWIPSRPSRTSNVGSLLKFGGTVTLNSLVVYIAYNADKAILGKFWGAEVLGIYSRAYQLVNLPTDSLTSAISAVALPALARVQQDALRLRRYFVQGYSVFLAMMIPLTVACALFSDDIVRVFLGAKWVSSAEVFRLLTPTMLVFALINPLSWMLFATARTTRSLAMACVIAPITMVGYTIGVRWSSEGVAIGFSSAMVILAIPMIMWAIHGTPLRLRDIFSAFWPAWLSASIGGLIAVVVGHYLRDTSNPLMRLCLTSGSLFAVYATVMILISKDASLYLRMWRDTGFVQSATETSTTRR